MKIGVFDSGIGGITVLKELRKRFVGDDFFYFGDNANLPYGTKSPEQIKSLAVAAAKYISTEKIEALVIACNTASAIAIEEIREVMQQTPVFSVVDAGVESILRAYRKDAPILILGTRATVRSHVYRNLIQNILSEARVVEQECPLLVPMIEETWLDHPILELAVKEYLKTHQKSAPGVALLACTHYPWIKSTFEKFLPGWTVIDSAVAMGEALEQHFSSAKSLLPLNSSQLKWQFSDPGSVPAFIFEDSLFDEPEPAPRIKSQAK